MNGTSKECPVCRGKMDAPGSFTGSSSSSSSSSSSKRPRTEDDLFSFLNSSENDVSGDAFEALFTMLSAGSSAKKQKTQPEKMHSLMPSSMPCSSRSNHRTIVGFMELSVRQLEEELENRLRSRGMPAFRKEMISLTDDLSLLYNFHRQKISRIRNSISKLVADFPSYF